MKTLFRLCMLLVLIANIRCTMVAQDLKIFGFGQMYYRNQFFTEENIRQRLGTNVPGKNNLFLLQQANLMLSSDFGRGFSFFGNLEFTNNFDLNRNFGNFTIQEFLVRYKNSDGSFQVKFGSFLPKFNSFLEIYNRFPLMPYIFRPAVYETQLQNFFAFDDFFPPKANIQIYGVLPLNDQITLDYAVYHANPEFSFMTTAVGGSAGAINTTTNMQYGGRLGIKADFGKAGSLTLGGSITSDLDNQRNQTVGGIMTALGRPAVNLGDVSRTRIGGDITYSVAGFTLNAEIIKVSTNMDANQQTIFDNNLGRNSTFPSTIFANGKAMESLDKLTYYGALSYQVLEDVAVYTMYSHIEDKGSLLLQSGVSSLSIGATYSPIENILIKAQYFNLQINEPNNLNVFNRARSILLGTSVMF